MSWRQESELHMLVFRFYGWYQEGLHARVSFGCCVGLGLIGGYSLLLQFVLLLHLVDCQLACVANTHGLLAGCLAVTRAVRLESAEVARVSEFQDRLRFMSARVHFCFVLFCLPGLLQSESALIVAFSAAGGAIPLRGFCV